MCGNHRDNSYTLREERPRLPIAKFTRKVVSRCVVYKLGRFRNGKLVVFGFIKWCAAANVRPWAGHRSCYAILLRDFVVRF